MPPVQTRHPGAALRVLVDLTRLCSGGSGGGIKPALLEMLRWLGRPGALPIEFVYLANADTRGEVDQLARAGDAVFAGAMAPADVAAREGCGVVYCPFGFTDRACPGIPTVSLIVDLLHRDFPATLKAGDLVHREQAMLETVARTDVFQVISDFTAGRLRHHYGVPQEQILRTYLPIHERLPLTPPPAARKNFFFYPANGWVHKNHGTLLAAFALYRKQTTAEPWSLVLCGYHGSALAGWQADVAKAGLTGAVEFLGYVDDRTLARLWNEAGALVFPSLHEGFGIPVLEAMHHGVPVLADSSTVVPEIAGDAALFADARRPEELANAMRLLAEDGPRRTRLAELGRQRIARFQIDDEFGRLAQRLQVAATRPARYHRNGYHPEDGLLEPLAIFALPACEYGSELSYEFAPLGIARTVEISVGRNLLGRLAVPANEVLSGSIGLPAAARTLSLFVPDASKLSPTDPRTHGVLVRRLQVGAGSGAAVDLLA
jgi:glycosyltransferase involved in cell wall biosynthesis